MMSEHFDCGFGRDKVVDVLLEVADKSVESGIIFSVVVGELFDLADVAFGDLRDVLCPLLPVKTIADAFDHAGVKKIFPLAEVQSLL